MVIAGRKPIPTRAKELAGNPGNRPLNENEPEPVAGAPERPELRDDIAEKAWDVLCAELSEMEILAKSDGILLAICAETWSLWREALRIVSDEGGVLTGGKGGAYANPWANLETMYAKRLESYVASLGLSPTARARVQKIMTPDTKEGKGRFFKVVG